MLEASERNLSERLLHIRDDAFASLDGAAPSFAVDLVEDDVGPDIYRRVWGTFEVPQYLTGAEIQAVSRHEVRIALAEPLADLLDILVTAKENGALTMVHAENNALIKWMVQRLIARGYDAPKYHAVSHPAASEAEAIQRGIAGGHIEQLHFGRFEHGLVALNSAIDSLMN